MAGLLDNLADFFEGLFSSDPQALQAKRHLRELSEALAEARPPVYAPRTDQILPAWAQGWGQAHALLQPLRELFDKTIAHPDRKVQDLFLAHLVEAAVAEDLPDRRAALGHEALVERLGRSDDPGREMGLVTSEFNALMMDLRRQDTDRVQKDFEGLYRLKALASHNLVGLLHRFGHSPSATAQHYRAVEVSPVLPDLLDLYFVTEGLEVGPGVEALIGSLLERVGPQKAAENRRKTGLLLTRFRDLLVGPCSPGLLINLIRVGQRNPEAMPDTQRFHDRFVQTYAASVSERFFADRDRAQRERSESSLETDIEALFPGATLLTLDHYNEETSDRLVEAGLPSLGSVKALRIVRSFGFSVLKAGYLDAIKRVVIDGQFNDKDWQQRLSDSLYAGEESLARVEAFDRGLPNDQKAGLGALEKYLEGKAPISSVPKALVEKMNRNALAVLEEEARVLSFLAQRVQEILTDYKTPQPVFVMNIKGLGGKDQRPLLEALINGYNKTAQLLKILKHFVVVK